MDPLEDVEVQALLQSHDWDALIGRADELSSNGQSTDAARVLRVAAESGSGAAAHNLGVDAEEAGDRDSAERWYRQAWAMGYQPAAVNLGRVLEDVGDINGAREIYEAAARGGDIQAMVNLGILLTENSSAEEASRLLSKAAEVDGRYNWQLGDLYRSMEQADLAIDAYRRAISAGERRAGRDLATILDPANEAEVCGLFEMAIGAGAVGAEAEYAEYLLRRGHVSEAESVARTAFQRGDGYAPLALARILAASGRQDEARQMYRIAEEHGDDVSEELNSLP